MAEKVNLEEIKNIPEEEFKKQLIDWIEDKGVAKSIQSKLRKDLFDSFNRTSLGRQIASQYQQSHRIILSPLILGLNTLVAEFLYAQNCHFSLSVFSTEVPYKNTLPDFDNINNFRFTKHELKEVFEALGSIGPSSPIGDEIVGLYTSQGSQINTSLLYSIFKILVLNRADAKIEKSHDDVDKKDTKIHKEATAKHNCSGCSRKYYKSQKKNSKYFKHFNNYLELLSKHLIEMNNKLENLKTTSKKTNSNPGNSEKLEYLNKSLDKITENLSNLSKSNKQRKKVTEIIKSITQLSSEVGKCGDNFEKLFILLTRDGPPVGTSILNPQQPVAVDQCSYSEWLDKLQNTKYGQKFISHLEHSQQKIIEKEKERMTKVFEEKMENNRLMLKLHYKQKILEKFRDSFGESLFISQHREHFQEIINKKLISLKEKKENVCVPKVTKIEEKRETYKHNNVDADGGDNRCIRPLGLSYHTASVINIGPQITPNMQINEQAAVIQDTTTNPMQKVPCVDNIVQFAKNRLQELENESEQLDQSFQAYLKKQEEEKKKLNRDVSKIWENYVIGKDILNNVIVPKSTIPIVNVESNLTEDLISNNLLTDSIPQELDEMIKGYEDLTELKFENPFRKMKPDSLRKTKIVDLHKNKTSYHLDVALPQGATNNNADSFNDIKSKEKKNKSDNVSHLVLNNSRKIHVTSTKTNEKLVVDVIPGPQSNGNILKKIISESGVPDTQNHNEINEISLEHMENQQLTQVTNETIKTTTIAQNNEPKAMPSTSKEPDQMQELFYKTDTFDLEKNLSASSGSNENYVISTGQPNSSSDE